MRGRMPRRLIIGVVHQPTCDYHLHCSYIVLPGEVVVLSINAYQIYKYSIDVDVGECHECGYDGYRVHVATRREFHYYMHHHNHTNYECEPLLRQPCYPHHPQGRTI
jgi:hypothetical protein